MGRDLSTTSPAVRLPQTYPPLPIPYPLSFHILAHSFALTKSSTSFFSSASALFAKNHRGWGWVHSPQFPAWEHPVCSLMNRVYLDFNATTPVEPEVLDAMLPYFSAEFANAASIHTPGHRARAPA